MSAHDLQALSDELHRLHDQVEALEAAASRRQRRWRRGGALAAALGLVATAAVAADGNCPNGLPFCFQPNQPARSSEVNHNFAHLREWLEAKVGPKSSNQVQAASGANLGAGTLQTPPASSGRALFASGNTTAYDAPIAEFRHSNLSQGVGLGWSSVFATGSTSVPNQNLDLLARGTGSVTISPSLTIGGDTISRFRAIAPVSVTASLAYNQGLWEQTVDGDLGPEARTTCFLQRQSNFTRATTLSNNARHTCTVFVDAGTWKVRASVSRGHHQETDISVACTASCLTWGT